MLTVAGESSAIGTPPFYRCGRRGGASVREWQARRNSRGRELHQDTRTLLARYIGQRHDKAPPRKSFAPVSPTSRLSAALSLIGAMAITGANVAFAKAIVAEVPVYIFVLFRFAVASAALMLLARGEAGPRLAHMQRGTVARPDLDGAHRHGRLHGAHVRGREAHGRGRCRHHHSNLARCRGRPRRRLRRRSPVASAADRGRRWRWLV